MTAGATSNLGDRVLAELVSYQLVPCPLSQPKGREVQKLPTKPDMAHRAMYVANILAVYDSATPEQRSRGASWYRNAHDLAGML